MLADDDCRTLDIIKSFVRGPRARAVDTTTTFRHWVYSMWPVLSEACRGSGHKIFRSFFLRCVNIVLALRFVSSVDVELGLTLSTVSIARRGGVHARIAFATLQVYFRFLDGRLLSTRWTRLAVGSEVVDLARPCC